ncbi:MAG: crotonase/enoyl-CoA hydratase family protein [SAR86 cluster bacterium]|uniref:Crotonase/enoyl-CoA hydratase family protein n=1 Tax=SAR86 cluster bacterium TaxID=2030880 RepID=A0A838Y112_9GAMM|nr:crotonase/enoyl-CoA hydratase family protein [SAR86 cluster bacterium]
MDFSTIKLERHENLALLFLNRPEKLNAFTFLMMEELICAFDLIEEDDTFNAVIISGIGRGFCAGADLSSGKNTFNPSFDNFAVQEDDFRRDSGGILTLRMYKFLKPIIFACNGPAVGIGASMQLPGDIRIASEDARFGFVFNNRGIVPDACSSWFLPKIVGISKALDLTFSGRIIDSKEALDIALISSIHKPENLINDAKKIAQELVEKSAPVSIAITRQMLWRSFGQAAPYEAHVIESKAIDSRGASDDAKEGVNSFLEKRPARFKNLISSDMPDFFPWWEDID